MIPVKFREQKTERYYDGQSKWRHQQTLYRGRDRDHPQIRHSDRDRWETDETHDGRPRERGIKQPSQRHSRHSVVSTLHTANGSHPLTISIHIHPYPSISIQTSPSSVSCCAVLCCTVLYCCVMSIVENR